jgi:single-strand DNA-binding protein
MTPTTTAPPTAGYVGNLASDPELRFGKSGTPWMRARLSVQPHVAGADVQPEPVFLDLVCFGSLAENVAESCRKGSRIVVSGRLEEDTWTGRDGLERTTTKLIADAIGFDLRFASSGATRSTPTPAPTPAPAPAPAIGITDLLGPATSYNYSEEPF